MCFALLGRSSAATSLLMEHNHDLDAKFFKSHSQTKFDDGYFIEMFDCFEI